MSEGAREWRGLKAAASVIVVGVGIGVGVSVLFVLTGVINIDDKPIVSGGGPITSTTTAPPTASVPEVFGEGRRQAKRDVERAGFVAKVVTKPHPQDAGTVYRQVPKSGADRRTDSPVRLFISEGWPSVPNLGGFLGGPALAIAKARLNDAKLHHRVVWVYDSYVSLYAPNQVVRTRPAGGKEVKPKSVVTLYVAKPYACTPGYSPCLPPHVMGRSLLQYDCAGGTGDGPYYAYGTIRVTGSDPYGLDGDNNGWGC